MTRLNSKKENFSQLYVVYEHNNGRLDPKVHCTDEQEAEDLALVGSAAADKSYFVKCKSTNEDLNKSTSV